MKCVAVLFVILLTIQLEVIEACPSGCSCFGTTTDCTGSALTSIPTNIDPSTTNLYLTTNAISNVPSDAFDGLVNLEVIDLGFNDISTVPSDAFAGLVNLQLIQLDNNNLSTVPIGAFDGLSQLQELSLGNNPTLCCTMLDVIELGKTLPDFKLDCTDFGQQVSYKVFDSAACGNTVQTTCKDAGGICVSQKTPCNTEVLNMKCSRCFPKCCKKP